MLLGFILQADNHFLDNMFNRIYNGTLNTLIQLRLPHLRTTPVDEINIIRDDIDGITRNAEYYKLE